MLTPTRRSIFAVACAALVPLLAILALHQNGSIETSIVIDRPAQEVWRVLTATDDYPAWNPEITRLSGQLREGNVIEFVEGSGPDAMVFHPTILTVQRDRELRWKGYVGLPGIFDGDHRFVLRAAGDGTRVIQSETFTGILAGTLTAGVLQSTTDSMQAMNVALKTRVEQLPR